MMSENIREGLKTRKRADSGEQALRETMNLAATKAMRKFIQRLDNEEIPIDNVADAVRVFGLYKEINNIEDMMEGSSGNGALPEINLNQSAVMDKHVTAEVDAEGEERVDVSELSVEDMTKLIGEMDREQNKENERTF